MTTVDVNGILRWESTDPITPLESTLNAGMDSVSAAVTGVKNGTIHFVANTTERAAKALAFAPSASKPLYVHRQDAPVGMNLEYTTNGTVWRSVSRGQRIVNYATSDRFWGVAKTANDVDILLSNSNLLASTGGRATWTTPASLGFTGISSVTCTPGAVGAGSAGPFWPAVEIFGGNIAATLYKTGVPPTTQDSGWARLNWQIVGWGPAA